MKRISILLLILLLATIFLPFNHASAAAKAGIKPGSIFYFFDTTFEKINLFFTFNPEKKAQKNLEYADERLAEAEAVAEEKNTDAVKTAVAGYENNIASAAEESKQVKDKVKTEELLNSIADNTSKHQEILAEVYNKVPDEAKEAITKAIEASKKGQEEATKQITELKGEIEQLKKEVAELKAKDEAQTKIVEELNKRKPESAPAPVKSPTPSAKIEETKTTNIATLPNGAVVEMDAKGNITHIVKEAPIPVSVPQVTQTNNRLILTSKQIATLVSPSVVLISSSGGNGSGFVINNGRIIVTNAHVVKNASIVDVKLADGTTFRGTVLGRDEFVDLALLSTGNNRPPSVSLGSSDIGFLSIGDDVYTLGYPLSLSEGLTNITFTKGILSARQKVNWYSGTLLQTDAVINHGNSGGPLINNYGEVVGVNTFSLATSDTQGIYFAIPIDTVNQLMTDLLGGLNKTIFDVPAKGNSVTIPRSMVSRIGLNPNLSCTDFGFSGNDLTRCGLYKNNYKDYQWIILESE